MHQRLRYDLESVSAMIILLFAIIIFVFLFVGALVFVCCIVLPQAREHALSAALWCAVWGPCLVTLLMLAGLGLIATATSDEHWHRQQLEHLPSVLGPTYVILGLLGSAAIASGGAWLHQLVIHRMTFPLFRIYASVVSAGVGSIYGWSLGFWLSADLPGHLLPWLAAMLLLCISFGYGGFRFARQLRGSPPENFTWVTPEEFEGSK